MGYKGSGERTPINGWTKMHLQQPVGLVKVLPETSQIKRKVELLPLHSQNKQDPIQQIVHPK